MDAFESFLLLLPSGAGGHHRDAERLRAIAELHGYDGWLLGCRDKGWRHGRRRLIMVTPLAVLGTPAGTIGAALTAAGGGTARLRVRPGRRRRGAMTADPDAIGPDGTVRLRRYLRHENIWWLSVGCGGCGHLAPVGVRAAIEIMGSGDATVGQLERRLRCT